MTSFLIAARFVCRGFLHVKMPLHGLSKSVHYHRSQGDQIFDTVNLLCYGSSTSE